MWNTNLGSLYRTVFFKHMTKFPSAELGVGCMGVFRREYTSDGKWVCSPGIAFTALNEGTSGLREARPLIAARGGQRTWFPIASETTWC